MNTTVKSESRRLPGMDKARPRVLVVDDDPIALQRVVELLEDDFEVHATCRPKEALEMLDRGLVCSAVVCDLLMPHISGLDLIRCIRERDADLPVIVLTSQKSLAVAMKIMEYRGFRYLTKPSNGELMREAVRSATATHEIAMLRRQAIRLCEARGWNHQFDFHLERSFEQSLEQLFMVHQPIVESNGSDIFGYESLVRSHGSELTNPGALFDAAERLGRLHDLGRRVRSLVAERMEVAPRGAVTFVNVHPMDLDDDELYLRTAPLSRFAKRVVLEITERSTLAAVGSLPERLEALRKLGYRIAVDDLGAGHSGLSSFSELKPDIVKLDMSLIRDLDSDGRKRSLVGALLKVCERDLATRVVCEGVETREEYFSLLEMGADLLQGYFFGRPSPHFGLSNWVASHQTSHSSPPSAA